MSTELWNIQTAVWIARTILILNEVLIKLTRHCADGVGPLVDTVVDAFQHLIQ